MGEWAVGPVPISGSEDEHPRVLVADDQADVREALRLLLKAEGYSVQTVSSPAAVLAALADSRPQPYDLLVMDLNYARDTTSGHEGLELLARVRAFDSALPVVVMTAWSSVSLAVALMRDGAADFVQKPWHNQRLLAIAREQVTAGRLRRRSVRLEADARDVQRLLLKAAPLVPGYDLGAAWRFADGLGGDGHLIAPLAGGRLAVAISDVCGKGTPAALLMASVQATLEDLVAADPSPRELCTRLLGALAPKLSPARFVSLVYAVLDPARATLTYANAGHPAPLLLRADGAIRRLERGGRVLGPVLDGDYEEGVFALRRGDRLVLVTDGVTEASRPGDGEFGDDRLRDAVVALGDRPAHEAATALLEQVTSFGGGTLSDDATIVCVDVS